MKQLMVCVVLTCATLAVSSAAIANALEIDVEQEELGAEDLAEAEALKASPRGGDCPFLVDPNERAEENNGKPLNFDGTTVVNTGDSNWDVIANGKTVLGFQFRAANALPVSVRSERRLTQWSDLVGSRFTLSAKNLLGFEVHRVQFDVTYRYGGRLAEGGRYIGSINVTPRVSSNSLGHWMSLRVCDVKVGPRSEFESDIAVADLHICYDAMSFLDKKSKVIRLRIDGETGSIDEVRD